MFFDLEKAEQGDWFPFFESEFDLTTGEITYLDPEPDAPEFRIRSMGPFFEERRKGRKKESKMVLNPLTRSMERVSYYPDLPPIEADDESMDAWDYAITGIRNAFSAPNVPLKCDRETKIKLLKIPKFLRYVQRVFQILNGEANKAKEDLEKNL